MQFTTKSLFALMAVLKLAQAGRHGHGHGPVHIVQKKQIVFVTQEVLEVIGYTSTVWVQPPPPSETPTVETPSPTPEQPAPVVETTQEIPSPQPVYTPQPQPEAEAQPVKSSPSSGGNVGKATFYDAGLGSCGETHSNTDMICALSKATMSLTAGANPNLNPKCGTKIRVTSASNPEGVIVTIVDTCPGCAGPYDLDLSPAAFDQLGNQLDGVISISWTEV